MSYLCLFAILFTSISFANVGVCDKLDNALTNMIPCETEIDTEIKNICPQTTHISEMFFNYFNYRDNRIDRVVFKGLVENYCGKSIIESQCVLDNVLPIILLPCNSSDHYDHVLVKAKYNNIFSKYFCENNQTRYMDTIEDDGVNCLFNLNFAECFYTHSLPMEEFTSARICGLLETNINCEHHFHACVNQYIKIYRAELFRLLKEKFNCL